jgi:hypothetical protein
VIYRGQCDDKKITLDLVQARPKRSLSTVIMDQQLQVSLNALTEDGLYKLASSLPRRCILLLEDLDAIKATNKRVKAAETNPLQEDNERINFGTYFVPHVEAYSNSISTSILPGRMRAGSSFSLWLVVIITIRPTGAAAPSRKFNIEESVIVCVHPTTRMLILLEELESIMW